MKTYIKILIGIAIGSLLGYAYYFFIGCNGSCSISSSWINSTAYGAFVGLLMAFPFEKKKVK